MDESLQVIREVIKTTINETIKSANLLVFDTCSLIISIIAIIISIWTVFRSEKIQFRTKIYDNLLQKPLQEELPELINNAINEENCNINGKACTKLEKFIDKFRHKILVFKYNDLKFYKKMDSILIDMDEKLVVMTNRDANFSKNYSEFVELVKKLYKTSKKYIS